MVYVNWQALQVYHPLWDAVTLPLTPQRSGLAMPAGALDPFSMPETKIQPSTTPESELRRQRLLSTTAQQQQALSTRLQAVEERLLQTELTLLDAEQKSELEAARQEAMRKAERAVEEALRTYQPQQASAEIRRRVIQRLIRVRPDQRDILLPQLEQIEARQQTLSADLQAQLANIEQATGQRIREGTEAIQREYAQRRDDLRERSARRLQAEQLRASVQIRAFADNGEPVTFPRASVTLPTRASSAVSAPVIVREEIRPDIEAEVKQWVEALCRKQRWTPVWQLRTGIPDVTEQIAREMRGQR